MTTPIPKHFFWGAATSAHQVEGNMHNDWSEWEKLGKVKHGERSGMSAGHFQRFREDFALAKKLSHNAHRFSIEWSRIEPRPGVFDEEAIEHYRQVLQELRRLGLEPFVTLHHFTNPIWIQEIGAWTNPKTVDYFVRYVERVIQSLGSLATYWITINEPTVNTSLGYLTKWWPPERGSWWAAWQAIRHLVSAHQRAYQIIHRFQPHARVGSANNLSAFVPSRPWNPIDRLLTRFSQYWHNQWWLDQTFEQQDFIALNYYFYHPIRFRLTNDLTNFLKPEVTPGAPISDLGWQIQPHGLGLVLRWLKRYHRPIFITENGLADAADRQRESFIRDHVREIGRAVADGIDVRGYLHWSLLDNFEWREGYEPRFGLISVDYQTLERTIRQSAYAYQRLIESPTFPA